MYPQFRRGHLAAAVLFASSSLLGGQALAEDERLEELDERAEFFDPCDLALYDAPYLNCHVPEFLLLFVWLRLICRTCR